jgi:hypothetical protein
MLLVFELCEKLELSLASKVKEEPLSSSILGLDVSYLFLEESCGSFFIC